MLKLTNVSKSFGSTKVLKNLNVEFKSGLNFIMGPSGSGKSTLLKIISGMDKDYDGDVFYNGNTLKDFNIKELTSYYYNSVGFVWQNFQLVEHLSVEDNVKLVLQLSNLSNKEKERKVKSILESLAIENIAKNKIANLSGGQKQRVAIARALVKNPDIIIADEPTGALDRKSSNLIISILKKIAKNKMVIVVTHDKSLLDNECNAFLLKDGVINEITSVPNEKSVSSKLSNMKPYLSLNNATIQGVKNFKGLFIKFTLTTLILMMSSYFLLLNLTGTAINQQQGILDKLIEEKGNSIKNIDIVNNAISGGSTDEKSKGGNRNLDIEQNVSKVLNKYKNDERIEFFMPIQVIDNMTVTISGGSENHKVESSGSVPYVNDMVEGRMPNHESREVAISSLFVKKLGVEPKDVIGKKITVKGENFDWSSGQPKPVEVKVKDLTIVGVIDTTLSQKSPTGQTYKFEQEDSFVYGLDVVKELKKQLKSEDSDNISFTIRVKKLEDLMGIVEELNKEGITPLGEFESVRDILKINSTTKDQSKSITVIIAVVAILATLAVTFINAYLRKREIAILKINGYSKRSIFNLNIMEYILTSIVSIGIFLLAYPLINNICNKLFNLSVTGGKSMVLGIFIILVQGVIMGVISSIINSNVKITNNLMTGDR